MSFTIKHYLRDLLLDDTQYLHFDNIAENDSKKFYDVIKRTLSCKESVSLLFVGPRGLGKTKIIRNVFRVLQLEDNDKILIMKLNGLLHINDSIALQKMQDQIKKHLRRNFNDGFKTSRDYVHQLIMFALSDNCTEYIFLIIDEFDLFLQHKNQTLLYNLLDLTQSYKIPLSVIGLTSRMDILELFEKRVKSRFSQRIVQIFFEYSFQEYKNICKNYLLLPDTFVNKGAISIWNTNVEDFMQEPSVLEILKKQFDIDPNYRALQSLLLYPISKLTSEQDKLEAKDLIHSFKLCNANDSKCTVIQGLSTLELMLVVLVVQTSISTPWVPFNFEMIYNELKAVCTKKHVNFVHDKATALKAYENLIMLELIIPLEGMNDKMRKEFQSMRSAVHSSQLKEAVARYHNCPTQLKHWIISDLLIS